MMIKLIIILELFSPHRSSYLTTHQPVCSHPFYFGWMDLVCREKEVYVTGKFFLNDVEACLRKYHPRLDLIHSPDTMVNRCLKEYFFSRFYIQDNKNHKILMHFRGYRTEEEFCFFYASFSPVPGGECTLHSSLLMDGIPGQTNILRVIHDNRVQTFILNYSRPECKAVICP